jgi:hypothetical protein
MPTRLEGTDRDAVLAQLGEPGGLRRLAELDFEVMVPAHGDHLDRESALARITERIAFVERADARQRVPGPTQGDPAARLGHSAGNRTRPLWRAQSPDQVRAKAHLDHQVRRGILAPVWRRTEQEHS